VYTLVNVFRYGGFMAFLFPIICWSLATLTILNVYGVEKIRLWFNKQVVVIAILTATFQIVSLIFVSLFTSFGRSPYAFTPAAIILNIAYFSSALIAMELSRAYLIKSCPKRKIFTGIALTALFYAFISFSLTKFLTLGASAEMAKFLGSDFLPALAQSLFATYLALLGGPAASIAYLGTLEAFEWLSPILPNPPWAI
jgi:signal peptidase